MTTSHTSVVLPPATPVAGVQSLERAFGLLDLIAAHHERGVTLASLQAQSGLDRTTVHRMLRFLTRAGYVHRDATPVRAYRLGCAALGLGLAAMTRPPLLERLAPLMKSLARQSEDNVFLVTRLGDFSYTLHLEQGAVPMPRYRELVGATRLLGLGTGSMALLATLPDDEVQAHLRRHQADYAATPFSPLQIQRAIQRTRAAGYTLAADPGVAGAGYAFDFPGVGTVALSILSSRARMPSARRHALARLMADEVRSAGYTAAAPEIFGSPGKREAHRAIDPGSG